jgi:lon-related putative ATP-dependent protease
MADALSKLKVPLEKLRWTCDCAVFGIDTTENAKPLDGILGQKRALTAIEQGLAINSPGYNIYVSGMSGSGKTSTVKAMLRKLADRKADLSDIIYVNNFKEPRKPHCIKLPAGMAKAFRRDMKDLIDTLKKIIPNIFDNDEYKNTRNEIVEAHRDRQKTIFRDLERDIKKENFTMVHVQMGPYTRPMILPLIENQPVQFEQLESLAANGNFPDATLKKLKERHQVLYNDLENSMKKARAIEKELRDRLEELEKTFGMSAVEECVKDIKEKFPQEKIVAHLDEVQVSILENLALFKDEEQAEPQQQQQQQQAAQQLQMRPEGGEVDRFSEYGVNIVVDNSETSGAPVVIETTPNYKNLFGTIEKTVRANGQWTTDFTKITAGSILRADGGYLVVNLIDAVTEPYVWKTLKRTLKNRQLEAETADSLFFFMTSAMKPEPVDIQVKIVAIGDADLYRMLYFMDDEFKKIFKVKADFDSVMEKNDRFITKYASFVHKIVTDEKLKHFAAEGISAVVEEGIRMAGSQKKLTARFSQIADIVREATYHAEKGRSKFVQAKHVRQALLARRHRLSLIEDKIGEAIRDERILISTTGKKVGQINGLAVYNLGDYWFGKPSRITAEVSMGRAGIINIEREAKLSGKIHDKGILIISGLLRGMFAQNKPLTLSASICFEQNYGGIDGDSASAAEVFALLSELSEVPLKQSIAVTGSVNQKGEIQPIGGVNEKIEGFYATCKARGLRKGQGVIIPIQNVDDLMLDGEVVKACKSGKFTIYAISSIAEGIEIFTGKPAGEKGKDGKYTKGSIFALADERLEKLAMDLKDFGKKEKNDKPEKAEAKKAAKKKSKK